MNEKKSKILKVAQEVFLSDGFVAANMETIAERAQVTKQTLYRYFDSKAGLFDATLRCIGETTKGDFFDCLDQADNEKALFDFAKAFIKWHLSERHLKILRLIISEKANAPEISKIFAVLGHDETANSLSLFFRNRLGLDEPGPIISMWIGMLLGPRSKKLVLEVNLTNREIDQYALRATEFLLAALPQLRATSGQ